MKKYEDIRHLSRPASRHPRMRRQDRAKLFAPFAALTGMEDSIHARDRVLVPRAILNEDLRQRLDGKLRRLRAGDYVTVVYFLPEKGTAEETLGLYLTVSSLYRKVDRNRGALCLDGATIPLEDIAELTVIEEAEERHACLQ